VVRRGASAEYGLDLAYIHEQGYESLARSAAPALLGLLRAQGIRSGRVVDLACGAGLWARVLSARGYAVHGIDLSPAMIRRARARAPRATFACGSMTVVPLPPCDAVTAMGEAFNYLLRPAEVRGTFARVAAALRPGGLLVFDLLEPPKSTSMRSPVRVEDDWALVARIEEDPARRKVVRRLTWFRRAGRTYRRGDAMHRQRLYTASEVAAWLRRLGFRVRVRRGLWGLAVPGRRAVLIARKPAAA
jgi:SAM-dependent methyltransferase